MTLKVSLALKNTSFQFRFKHAATLSEQNNAQFVSAFVRSDAKSNL